MASNWQSEIMAAIELAVLDSGKRLILPTAAEENVTPAEGAAYIAAEFATVLSFAFDFNPEDCIFRFYPAGQSPEVAIGFVHTTAIKEFCIPYAGDGSGVKEMLDYIRQYLAQPQEQAG